MTLKARLKWHCRRGTRELDLLLEGFMMDRYEALSMVDRASFEHLLGCRNEDLMAWLINGDSPLDKRLSGIVNRIRANRAQATVDHDLAEVAWS